jgi:hypothetical protein
VPCWCEETFTTVDDDQPSIKVTVYQGNFERVADNQLIQGLIDGIGSMLGSLRDRIAGVAGTITDYLRLRSPAKKAPPSGRGNPYLSGVKISELLASGMHSKAGLVGRAAAQLAATVDLGFDAWATPSPAALAAAGNTTNNYSFASPPRRSTSCGPSMRNGRSGPDGEGQGPGMPGGGVSVGLRPSGIAPGRCRGYGRRYGGSPRDRRRAAAPAVPGRPHHDRATQRHRRTVKRRPR